MHRSKVGISKNSARSKIANLLGACCYYLIPIQDTFYSGKGECIGICTLSSLDLLKEIKNYNAMMESVRIVGRLLSENKGIDSILRFTTMNRKLRIILLCGDDVMGHFPGQSIVSLKNNGVDEQKNIIGAKGHFPVLNSSFEDIENFRKQIDIVNKIGLKDIKIIKSIISNLQR